MSSRLPRVTAADIIHVLEKSGFLLSRQSGSHKIYKTSQGKRVTVPYHSGKILHPKILKSILRDAEISVEELIKKL
ncbi:MAG: type II toxin-antitoxin system HicA family toxin [Ignavibacteriales bacterium]|nr:type II toxin-antitoxin system HicA family toxin [Ignavibacteriales bacterium]